jgi:hypothetical protein
MSNNLDLALVYLGVDRGQCLVLRETADEVVVVVDNGIAGCPKYIIPLSKLHTLEKVQLPLAEPEPEPVMEPEIVEKSIFDIDYETMDYRQLQALAKERDIPANQSREDLISALDSANYDNAWDEEE